MISRRALVRSARGHRGERRQAMRRRCGALGLRGWFPWNAAAMRHAYVAAEPDHRWGSQDDRGGTQYRSLRVVVNDLGLLAEHQAHGAVQADRGERLIRDVEQQYPTHSYLPGRCAVL